MCGIAGFVDPSTSADARLTAVQRMGAALQHRGADDQGFSSEGPATLGMRRLAIFDPAQGRQPMRTPDGRFHLIFNGAIFNFRELRNELVTLGFAFHTECDTEVLLAAFAHWGESCLKRLRGMFAFAVWDARERSLFVARDPFGIKPLYYSHQGGQLLFASELSALIASGYCAPEIDAASVQASLAYLAVPAPRTIYRHAFSLRPGECATFRDGRLAIRVYWSFHDAAVSGAQICRTRGEFVGELRERLEDSIRAHTLADVPVGAFLSGGLDSSAIAGLMARQTGATLKTFSIGFGEAAYSEAAEAAATARHLGTDHTTLVLTGERVAADIESLLAAYDQPTGDAVNTFYVSQAARAGGVTAALSGLGGDELFGGYPWFRTTPRLARWLPLWRAAPAFLRNLALSRLARKSPRHQKLADFLRASSNLHELAALQRRNLSDTALRELLASATTNDPHPELAHLPAELEGADPFSVISAWELRTYMADVLLRDSDIMSMRHSLELRVPFVDRPLLEWLWRQPSAFKDDVHRTPKSALAEAVHDLLPAAVFARPKRGFTLPFPIWMRGALRPFLDETFSTASIGQSGFFNVSTIRARWAAFLASTDPRDWSRLWSLAILINFVNRRRAAPSAA
jgi:asparagine synthase (glutamine-hydrolysing)